MKCALLTLDLIGLVVCYGGSEHSKNGLEKQRNEQTGGGGIVATPLAKPVSSARPSWGARPVGGGTARPGRAHWPGLWGAVFHLGDRSPPSFVGIYI